MASILADPPVNRWHEWDFRAPPRYHRGMPPSAGASAIPVRSMSQQTLHDPSAASEGSDTAERGNALRLVRIRLALVVVATAMVSAAASGTVAIVATVGPGGLFHPALGLFPGSVGGDRAGVLIVSVWLIRHGTRRVLQLAEELDQARRQFGDLQDGDRPGHPRRHAHRPREPPRLPGGA